MIKNPDIRALIRRLLTKEPSKRPLTIDIINDKWLTRNGEDPIDLDLSSQSGLLTDEDFATSYSDRSVTFTDGKFS